MKSPLVSVCMPAYNTEKYISEAIDSVLCQTYKNFELIIIDDCSTDRTYQIIKNYEKKDKRIKVYKNSTNLNIALNRNECIKKSKGKYIIWQDSDDLSLPNRIEKQVEFMEKNIDVGICGGWIQSFMDGKILDVRKYDTQDKDLRKSIFRYSPVAQPSAIIKKEAFDKVGLYNKEYPPAEDIDMSFRIGTHYKFANLSQILIKYREHPNSATSKKIRKIINSTVKIRVKNIKNKSYKFNLIDLIALLATFFIQIFPPKWIIYFFKLNRQILLILKRFGVKQI